MPNQWGRLNAPMEQPTKDELRETIREMKLKFIVQQLEIDRLTRLLKGARKWPSILASMGIPQAPIIKRRI